MIAQCLHRLYKKREIRWRLKAFALFDNIAWQPAYADADLDP